ncbi:Exopolyphosphatase [Mortierella sp. NVP85]|nr:Exopolyphosphatase [Mortierella sp. NVP85]
MSSLANAPVVGLLDHHVDEKMYQDTADPRRIEVVGSCATLVAKEFLQNALDNDRSDQDDTPHHHDDANDGHPHPWVRHVARLLLGAILADTMNLDPAMGKVQPLDIAMADLAFPLTGLTSKDELYRKIEKARLDTSKIQFYDLLRKDYKEWTVVQSTTGQPIKVGMSSVVGLMEQYVERDGKDLLHEKIDQWAKERELDVIVVGLAGDDNGKFKRQVIVNPMVGFVGDLGDRLGHVLDLKMERISLVDTDAFVAKGGRAFWQHNFAASRKQVWPAVEKLLTQTEERRSGLVNQANI